MKKILTITLLSFIYLNGSNIPEWFYKTDINRICGLGSNNQKKIAMILAKSDYIKQIEIKVSTVTQLSKNNNTNHMDVHSIQTSERLTNSLVIENIENIENIYYIKICNKEENNK